jgi:hypothetical protein
MQGEEPALSERSESNGWREAPGEGLRSPVNYRVTSRTTVIVRAT